MPDDFFSLVLFHRVFSFYSYLFFFCFHSKLILCLFLPVFSTCFRLAVVCYTFSISFSVFFLLLYQILIVTVCNEFVNIVNDAFFVFALEPLYMCVYFKLYLYLCLLKYTLNLVLFMCSQFMLYFRFYKFVSN